MLGALTQGVDFKCNTTICFGVGAVHDQFKALQTAINGFATIGSGFTPLVVDGFIGDKTVAAANVAAKLAGAPSPGATREAVATNALALTAQLQSMLQDLAIVGVTQPDAIATTSPPTVPAKILATEPPPPEIDAVVQQAVAACRASRTSPTCTRAKQLCRTVRGTTQAQVDEIREICDATRVPIWVWVLAGTGAVAAIGLGLYARRRRHQREAMALGQSATWWEERRPGNARAFRRAGFRRVPCDFPVGADTAVRCWEK
jgi:lysozyme family protein